MKLDRAYQRELLEMFAQTYPHPTDVNEHLKSLGDDTSKYVANMIYLDRHRLVDSHVTFSIDGFVSFGFPSITHTGMDFLADDGGLSAILGVVTVKLHEDTIHKLIEARIDSMPGSEADKAPLRKALEDVGKQSAKALIDRLIAKGIDALPGSLESLHTWLLAALK